jgi:TolB protein
MRALGGLLSALVLGAGAAYAQESVDIRIQGSAGRDYQAAVRRFEAGLGGAADAAAFHAELRNALAYSGVFQLIGERAFLEPVETADFEGARFGCENWRAIAADAVVEGRLERTPTSLRVHYRAWDVPRCQQQGETRWVTAKPDELWIAARRVADEIVERFTGRRGVASTQIAFVSDQGGNKEVYVMESDGGRKRSVTANGRINLFPAWSPKGEELLYTTFRGGVMDLWRVARGRRSGGGRVVQAPFEKYRGIYGPNDGQITFVMNREGNTDIYQIGMNGGSLRRLTEGRSIEVSPTWSPDGRRLAFASDRTGSPQIYVWDQGSGETRRLTFEGDYNTSPAWSPTGEWIAFAARAGDNIDIYLIDPGSLYTVPLITHPRSDEDPAWSPDGRKLAFTSSRRGRKEVYSVDLDGRNLLRLTENFGNSSNPAWSTWLE